MNNLKHIRPAPAEGISDLAIYERNRIKKEVFSTEKREAPECQSISLIGRKTLKDKSEAERRSTNDRRFAGKMQHAMGVTLILGKPPSCPLSRYSGRGIG
jgi:hypothetical protein